MKIPFFTAVVLGCLSLGCRTPQFTREHDARTAVAAVLNKHQFAPQQSGEILITKVEKGQPVTQVSTNDLYRDKLLLGLDKKTPDVEPDVPKEWRKTYESFGGSLVKSAKEAGLEAASLETILKKILTARENKGLAVVPVAAHQTQEKGESVWVVTLKWEGEKAVREGSGMAHIRSFTFTQKTLKKTDFFTCG